MTKWIIGNWKMFVGQRDSVALARAILLGLRGKTTVPSLVVCPPFPTILDVHKLLARSHVRVGAQDVSVEEDGQFTGGVSARLLAEIGCGFVIVGHAERRRLAHESDAQIAEKLAAVAKYKLVPILCVGEEREMPDREEAMARVRLQLSAASSAGLRQWMVAYEPGSAIGTGEPMDVKEVCERHRQIRSCLADRFGADTARTIPVLYGGSVTRENAYALLREPEISGVLLGRSGVKITQWQATVEAACRVLEAQADS